jgi:hypothetical protein
MNLSKKNRLFEVFEKVNNVKLNEANAIAGILMREFGKINPIIFE